MSARSNVGEPPPSSSKVSDPFFSILIATYNQAEYIAETLASVEAQTFTDYELIIVDDGSTDGTAERMSAWIEKFHRTHANRVVVSRIENSGQSAAMEHGFEFCAGEYICLLDSDDRWLPEKLAEVHRIASQDPTAGMIGHPVYVIGPDGRRTGDVRPKRARLSEGDLRKQVRRTTRQVAAATSGVVIRADVFRSLLPMPTRGFRSGADSYLTFGASLSAPVRVIAEPLAEYRLHPEGQYLQRMMTVEGLSRTVMLQRAIADHFGLEAVARRNSFFARNEFAAAKLGGNFRRQLRTFSGLAFATLLDGSFALTQRLVLLGYWTVCMLAPSALFVRLWRTFQLRQTGYDKVLQLSSNKAHGARALPR